MKKYCLLLLIIAVSFIAYGQSAIPNGNFETWTSGTYSYPQNFPYNSNGENAWEILTNSVSFNLIKTSESYHGTYAVQLSTLVAGNDTIFGYFINSQPNGDNFSDWTGGLPYTQQPTGIKGYYKYNVAANDSATVIVIFSKNGYNIGSYVYNIGGIHSSYTPFNFTFNPPLSECGLANDDIRALAIDLQGTFWIGTNGGGVSKFDGTHWETYTAANGLASDTIHGILIDELNNKWFTTSGGIKYDGTNWVNYTTADGLANNNVYGISKSNGKMWFGTMGGVSKFDGTSWTTISKLTTTTPDSVIVAAASSNVKKEKTGIPGSTLFIDSVSFVGVESQPTWLNGDFESWEDVTANMLDGWYIENQNGKGVYRTTDKVAGEYAVELVTYLRDKNGYKAAQPGIIRTVLLDR